MDKMLIYQMLPRLWGKGKFSSVDNETLQYVRSLGMDCVWYTGIPRHSTGQPYTKGKCGSPYSICDYYDVNPYMADVESERMEEFVSLVARTHDAGLKVIVDFVPNHVSPDYHDCHGGIRTFDYCDYDWTDTRKIDYGCKDNWLSLRDILLFWAGKGVDGFRCDMVEMVPLDFFRWVIAEVRNLYPDMLFIAEVYSRENYFPYIREAGFDLLYDKSGIYDILRSVMTSGTPASDITGNWLSLGDLQPHMLNFLENHDEQRLASPFFAGDAMHGLAALAAASLLNDASFMLYAGQEVGEDASESQNGRTSIFDLTAVPGLCGLYSFIHTGKGLGKSGRSVLARYREILHLAVSPLFRKGKMFDLGYCSGFDRREIFAFARGNGRKTCLVVANFSNRIQEVTVVIPPEAVAYLEMKNAAPESGVKVSIPPFGATVKEI